MRDTIKQKNLIFYTGEEEMVAYLTKANVGNVQEYIKRLILEDMNKNNADNLLLTSKAEDFKSDIETVAYNFMTSDEMMRMIQKMISKETQVIQERLVDEIKKEENRIRNDYNKKVDGLSSLIKNLTK